MPLARVNGINISYSVEGHGVPLVLIMGLGVDRSGWRRQVPAFKKSYQVITFDNRGIGKSDKPEGPYSPGLLAEDTVRLMDFLKIDKAHIMATSMGGLIAQEIVINYPERVRKLILGSTWACQDQNNGITPELLAASELPPIKGFHRLLDACFNIFIFRYILVPLLKFRARRMTESEETGLSGQIGCVLEHYSLDRLPQIKVPTLVITGTKDRVIKPESSITISKTIPGAKLVTIANGSHAICMEKSKKYNNEVLEFLQS